MADTIGAMRERVSIQVETQTPDGGGGYTLGWTTLATVWARVRPISGREALQAQQLESAVQYRVTIRTFPGLAAARHRLLWGSRPLNILAIRNPDEHGVYMEIDAAEGVAT